MDFIKRNGHIVLGLYVVFVFVQSLFFKFTDSPETIYIFEGKLDPWAASLGFKGLFARGGLFSAYVIGSFELIASTAVLIGSLVPRLRILQALGALLGLGVISGAIFFHLFTPLGVAVQNTDGSSDGGQLFGLACGVWISCAILIWLRRELLLGLIGQGHSKSTMARA
ncbi:MAG: DoxX family protein [Nevskia sp.]